MSATKTDERVLMEGSEALARAAIVAGCRFFAGYPMTPFTEVLEHFAKLLPDAGGVCINAESELEAVGMTWGALSTGARPAAPMRTSSTICPADSSKLPMRRTSESAAVSAIVS